MNTFIGKRKTSRVDMVIAILEKDIRTIKSTPQRELDLSIVQSVLTTALIRLERLQKNKNVY